MPYFPSEDKVLNCIIGLAKKVSDINAQLTQPSEHDIIIKGKSSVIINSLGESCDANKPPIQFGSFSNFVGHYSKKDENIIVTKMKQVDIMPKLKTIQGEDDEPMTHQIIDTKNYYVNSNKSIGDFRKSSSIRFRTFSPVERYTKRNKGICASAVPPSSIFFIGANLRQKQEMKLKRIILIGTMHVEVECNPTPT